LFYDVTLKATNEKDWGPTTNLMGGKKTSVFLELTTSPAREYAEEIASNLLLQAVGRVSGQDSIVCLM